MAALALAVLFALFLWWFSTGLIAWLDGLPRATFGWSLLAITGVSVAALYGIAATADDTSVAGAYCGFTSALLIWGWHEASFLMGLVTGPRRGPLPAGVRGFERFGMAVGVIAWHELAILATAVIIAALTWDAPNQTALWTFLLLWVMRVSAKLNVFLGVRNLSEEFLPEHLRYLVSYLRRRPINMLFPVSVTGCTVAAYVLFAAAVDPALAPGAATACALLGAMTALALLEHWFMVLPISPSALWGWALGARAGADAAKTEITRPGPDATVREAA